MNDERLENIPLKEVAGTPWRLWITSGLFVGCGLALLIGYRIWTLPPEPGLVPDAIAVDPDDPESMRMLGARPDALVSAEPTAEFKSQLYPDAITNYFEQNPIEAAAHPLDPALAVAQLGLERLQSLQTYRAQITKRERIGNDVRGPDTMEAKVRRHRVLDDGTVVRFAVYLKFIQPRGVAGREVIWEEDANNGNLLAHESGFANLMTLQLDPNGRLAMMGQRYPITEIGFDTLIKRMIEKGTRDRAAGSCRVEVDRWAVLNGRACTSITIIHDDKNPVYEFHRATIVIDDELNLPVKYAAWDWPASEGGEPQLLEEYTYLNVELDPAFTAADFDPNNEAYDYP